MSLVRGNSMDINLLRLSSPFVHTIHNTYAREQTNRINLPFDLCGSAIAITNFIDHCLSERTFNGPRNDARSRRTRTCFHDIVSNPPPCIPHLPPSSIPTLLFFESERNDLSLGNDRVRRSQTKLQKENEIHSRMCSKRCMIRG